MLLSSHLGIGMAAACCREQGVGCASWMSAGMCCPGRPKEQGGLWYMLTPRHPLQHFVTAVEKPFGHGGLQNASVSSASFLLPGVPALQKICVWMCNRESFVHAAAVIPLPLSDPLSLPTAITEGENSCRVGEC